MSLYSKDEINEVQYINEMNFRFVSSCIRVLSLVSLNKDQVQ